MAQNCIILHHVELFPIELKGNGIAPACTMFLEIEGVYLYRKWNLLQVQSIL